MDTKYIQNFLKVIESGSMSEAARQLDISPAAVAQQMRGLVVCSVHVLKDAVLLNYKDFGAQLQQRIQLGRSQPVESGQSPFQCQRAGDVVGRRTHAGCAAFST